MSMITKCFLVVFAVLCCMQLAEMARIPRSDAPAPSLDDIGKQLGDIFQNLVNTLQKIPEDERVKGLTDGLQNTLSDSLKKMSEAFPKDVKQN